MGKIIITGLFIDDPRNDNNRWPSIVALNRIDKLQSRMISTNLSRIFSLSISPFPYQTTSRTENRKNRLIKLFPLEFSNVKQPFNDKVIIMEDWSSPLSGEWAAGQKRRPAFCQLLSIVNRRCPRSAKWKSALEEPKAELSNRRSNRGSIFIGCFSLGPLIHFPPVGVHVGVGKKVRNVWEEKFSFRRKLLLDTADFYVNIRRV